MFVYMEDMLLLLALTVLACGILEAKSLTGQANSFVGDGGGLSNKHNLGGNGPMGHKIHHDCTVISPNLSSCHQSNGAPTITVNCCPPKLEEPFIDFQFPIHNKPLRIRRPAHLVDDEYIAKYNNAISIMKSLPYDDPRNFVRQSNVHCAYCTGAYNTKYSNVSLDIHDSWIFFPWHRMYLHFYERILAKLIGDDTFALPFWNWDSAEGMVIPNMYMNGSLFDENRDSSHLPPRVIDLNYFRVDSELKDDDELIQRNLALLYTQMVSGSRKPELFMGCRYKNGENGSCIGSGTLEVLPHNSIHSWVGSSLIPYRGDMGVFYLAALDPIFFAHHSNMDRLWEVWREMRMSNQPEFKDPDWLNSYFFFYDENSQLVRIRVRDVLDITKLGYSYEKVDTPWLNARPKPSVPPKIAREKLKLMNMNKFSCSKFEPEGRKLDSIIRAKVSRPKKSRSKKEKEEEEEVLVVYGIDMSKEVGIKVEVYVNLVSEDDEIDIGPESREFAGTMSRPRNGDKSLDKKIDLKLGITELIGDLEAEDDDWILVTLVPRAGTGVNSTIDGMRIEYMT